MACHMVMALLTVGSLSVASAGSSSAVMAAINAGLCTDGDSSCAPTASSAPSNAQPAEVWLLQLAAARAVPDQRPGTEEDTSAVPDEERGAEEDTDAHSTPMNMSNVWEKLKVATQVDKLRTAIGALSNSNITKQLGEDLKHALNILPLVEHVKQHFADHWEKVGEVADSEDVQSNLQEAGSGRAEASQLIQQMQDSQELPMSNVTDVQEQVAHSLDGLQGDLDSFTAHTGDVVKQLLRIVRNSTWADRAKAVRGLVHEIEARQPRPRWSYGAGAESDGIEGAPQPRSSYRAGVESDGVEGAPQLGAGAESDGEGA